MGFQLFLTVLLFSTSVFAIEPKATDLNGQINLLSDRLRVDFDGIRHRCYRGVEKRNGSACELRVWMGTENRHRMILSVKVDRERAPVIFDQANIYREMPKTEAKDMDFPEGVKNKLPTEVYFTAARPFIDDAGHSRKESYTVVAAHYDWQKLSSYYASKSTILYQDVEIALVIENGSLRVLAFDVDVVRAGSGEKAKAACGRVSEVVCGEE